MGGTNQSGALAQEPLKIDSLQGLRALAALMVVISHQIVAVGVPETYSWFIGGIGVHLFFIISGFIMITTSKNSFGNPSAPLQFIWRRLTRIAPLYWLVTAVYTIKLIAEGRSPVIEDLIKSLAFIPYLDAQGLYRPIYGLGWTLNYEMFFYMLFALALSHRFWIGVTGLVIALLTLVGVGTVLSNDEGFWTGQLIHFWTNPVILYFIAGIAAGLLRDKLEQQGMLTKDCVGTTFFISTVLLATTSVCGFYLPALQEFELHFAMCCLIFAVCAFRKSNPSKGRVNYCIVLVGNASYSIYLTHSLLAGFIKKLWGSMFHGEYQMIMVGLIVIGSIILGILCYRWVELPLLRIQKLPFSPATKPVPT